MKTNRFSRALAALIAALLLAALLPAALAAESVPAVKSVVYDNTAGDEPSVTVRYADEAGKKWIEVYGLRPLRDGETEGPMGNVEANGKTWAVVAIMTIDPNDPNAFHPDGEGAYVVKTKLYTTGAENKPQPGEEILITVETGADGSDMTLAEGLNITVPAEGGSAEAAAEPEAPPVPEADDERNEPAKPQTEEQTLTITTGSGAQYSIPVAGESAAKRSGCSGC